MIVDQVETIPPVPGIPTNQFRKWVTKRRFSAELKRKRAGRLGNSAGPPNVASGPRRSLSDMSWANSHETVELLMKNMMRSTTDDTKPPRSQAGLALAVIADLHRKSIRNGDVIVPITTQCGECDGPSELADPCQQSTEPDDSPPADPVLIDLDVPHNPDPQKRHTKRVSLQLDTKDPPCSPPIFMFGSDSIQPAKMPPHAHDHTRRGIINWAHSQFFRICTNHHDQDLYSHVVELYPPTKADHVMSHPLAYYFVSSGHNSYLTGNQVTSRCSAQAIADTLKLGCRVIELDVWNSKRGPRVDHGFTMTKSVAFEKCIRAVRKHAFQHTKAPLVITLENHCNQINKNRIVKILNDELGDMLYWTKQNRTALVKFPCFPSPGSLKGRILIRDKDDALDEAEECFLSDAECDASMPDSPRPLPKPLSNGKSFKMMFESFKVFDSGSSRKSFKVGRLFTQKSMGKAPREPASMTDLVSIINVKSSLVGEVGFAASYSRSEAALVEMATDPLKSYKLTQRHLLRIYPHARRIDSSNFDPFSAWLLGAQLVAINWQTPGIPLWVYNGFFMANGGCGFVHKPSWMLGDKAIDLNNMPVRQMLSIHIHSARCIGHHFPQENFVQVDLYGIPKDTCTRRTRVRKGRDACTWDEVVHIPVRCSEMAVLLVMLRCKEVVTGHVAIPLNGITLGRYAFPLLDKYCRPHNSRRNLALVLDIQLRGATGSLRKLVQGE
eukprot:c39011_g1_i1.p1 GENE.c39011_g1_i1~~c39011_g1_i1.p1  ORF type:complete len:724 (-),score=121.50 c39011_g1_i1:54-2225(-)